MGSPLDKVSELMTEDGDMITFVLRVFVYQTEVCVDHTSRVAAGNDTGEKQGLLLSDDDNSNGGGSAC